MLTVIYEDNHLLVVNKPAGLLSQGDYSGDNSIIDLAKDYIRKTKGKQGNIFCGLVHRLDRSVSGIMVLARTSKAAERLSRQFSGRSTEKFYLFAAEGEPLATLQDWQRFEGHYHRDRDITRTLDLPTAASQPGSLWLKIIRTTEKKHIGMICLETGRKHQIRSHLKKLGIPVAGDGRYGSAIKSRTGAISLHAWRLVIEHPVTKERLVFTAPVPPRFYPHGFPPVDDSLLNETILALQGKKA